MDGLGAGKVNPGSRIPHGPETFMPDFPVGGGCHVAGGTCEVGFL